MGLATDIEIVPKMQWIIDAARLDLSHFLRGAPLNDNLLRASVRLAHCDVYARARRLDSKFPTVRVREIQDLRQLIAAVPSDLFDTITTTCILNPDFGYGSLAIGGADADLVIDDMLVDIKTSSRLTFETNDWYQLLGYVALHELYPMGGHSIPIRRIGIYFSRHGFLASWTLSEVVDRSKFAHFVDNLRDVVGQLDTERLRWQEQMRKWEAEEDAERESDRERRRRGVRKAASPRRRQRKLVAKQK